MMNKSDDHYAAQRAAEAAGSGKIETIKMMESIALNTAIPTIPRTNVVLAMKHMNRAGEKAGEDWRKELQKSINYLTRAVTGDFIKEAKPLGVRGSLKSLFNAIKSKL